MDELVRLVAGKTGIGEDLARQAVEMVLGYLKDRLPEGVAKYIDAFASGKDLPDDEGGLLGKVGRMLGR